MPKYELREIADMLGEALTGTPERSDEIHDVVANDEFDIEYQDEAGLFKLTCARTEQSFLITIEEMS